MLIYLNFQSHQTQLNVQMLLQISILVQIKYKNTST